MKFGAAILTVAFLALSAFAGTRMVVPSLPEPVRPLAEVETNVFFDAGVATDNKWMLTIERDAAASNSVEVVFGRDANEDGVLGIEEGELLVGWDCGEWLWRDRRANAACRVAGSGSRMDWRLRLSSTVTSSTEGSDPSVEDCRAAKSLASSVFPPVVLPTCFNPDWNLARVISRGVETLRVESKVTIDALTLRIR
ncbi:MAG: hypothetical protein IKU71_01515 [Kiritimatiellae bacterium]|nr:hypothetical protein [Kiritimatiellia bacterium]